MEDSKAVVAVAALLKPLWDAMIRKLRQIKNRGNHSWPVTVLAYEPVACRVASSMAICISVKYVLEPEPTPVTIQGISFRCDDAGIGKGYRTRDELTEIPDYRGAKDFKILDKGQTREFISRFEISEIPGKPIDRVLLTLRVRAYGSICLSKEMSVPVTGDKPRPG